MLAGNKTSRSLGILLRRVDIYHIEFIDAERTPEELDKQS